MHILSKRSLSVLIAGSALIGSLALAGTALAAGPMGFGHSNQKSMRPVITGTVASISGNTLTVNAKNWKRENATTTTATVYTVDATNATVMKGGSTSTVSAIAIGDPVTIQGTISGTTVTATSIRDGKIANSGKMSEQKSKMEIASHTPSIVGNGQPVIGGTVTAVSGSVLTVTNKSNITYTVNAVNTTITKMGVGAATLANIVVGDSVVVQGTVNNTSVTASSVIDQGTAPSASGKPSISNPEAGESHGGFMGAIGGFFSHLFGF